MYKREEVYNATLKYFNGDTLATDVWINKYSLKDTIDGELNDNTIYFELTPEDMHRRLAKELHRIENKYLNPLSEKIIFDLIKNFKYIIPQGSPMSGIGNDNQTVSLSNCFVIGNDADSYGGIFLTDQEQAQLMKRRGGVGHDLSHIRPKGIRVKNSALTSTGVVPFMERYSNTTNEVAQDGRRGALMLTISVEHPDAEKFIDAKMKEGKITGANISIKINDKFMKAVNSGGEYVQNFPIESKNPTFSKKIDAKKLWDKIIHNAHKSAEPGILFWDTVIKESVSDCYEDQGFRTISTNPCLVGDTLISVSDGRNFVSIKQLAKEGKDIPVYTIDNNDKLTIRTMRNPRITGYNQQIYKVNIEGDHSVRVTGNHEFKLKNGKYVQVKDLKNGDSLHIMTKSIAAFHDVIKKSNSKSQDYCWLSNTGKKGLILEHRIIAECDRKILKNEVVHHKDYNGLNNNLDNLQIMTKEEHDILHSVNMLGDNNPYHRMSNKWKFNFASHPEKKNPKYINITNDEIIEHAKLLTKKLNRRFSKKDWIKYAEENKLIRYFSDYREKTLGNIISLSKMIAIELGYDDIDTDPRLVKTFKKALENGYNAEIVDNEVIIDKICEICGNKFKINYFKREISFCSNNCALDYINNNEEISKKRRLSINNTYHKKSVKTKEKQIKIFSDLKFEFGREPKLKEWENKCKDLNISYRLKTKYGFDNFKEIKESADFYNHKVVSVELDGIENVYNGTVDEFHNFYIGGFEETNRYNKVKYLSINNLQCGELPLNGGDSCRLLAINLYSYVINPFTSGSYFDYDLFIKHIQYAQRFMDDIVDLEIEKIDKILAKVKTDPEPDHIKSVEINLWTKIKEMSIKGRRTGLGITAEGDMIAALGLRYGTKKATKFSTKIHKMIAINAYKSSSIMAKERGSFPIYEYEKEINNPFIGRLKEDDIDLDNMLKEGRRNISLLTVAPTGSLSILTQTTSGIEPVYLVSYKRRRKINPNDKEAKSDYIDDQGVHWEEYNVFHHKFEVWLKINGYNVNDVKMLKSDELKEIVKKSPYYKATSNDIDWIEKVRMQGSIQKYVDHSISVTVNLPKDTTEEIVSKVYNTGWKTKCKGLTVYRDGSRQGVIISNEEKSVEQQLKENNAQRRPKRLECEIIKFTNNKEKWIGFLGIHEDDDEKYPYELFTGFVESFPIPIYVESGTIIRVKENGRTRYDFEYIDREGYKMLMQGLNRAFNREFWNTSKMVSALLRHKIHLPSVINIIDSLDMAVSGEELSFGTWKSGVKRIIKKWIKDSTEVIGEVCPECGSFNIIYSGGCKTCGECGWAKC